MLSTSVAWKPGKIKTVKLNLSKPGSSNCGTKSFLLTLDSQTRFLFYPCCFVFHPPNPRTKLMVCDLPVEFSVMPHLQHTPVKVKQCLTQPGQLPRHYCKSGCWKNFAPLLNLSMCFWAQVSSYTKKSPWKFTELNSGFTEVSGKYSEFQQDQSFTEGGHRASAAQWDALNSHGNQSQVATFALPLAYIHADETLTSGVCWCGTHYRPATTRRQHQF